MASRIERGCSEQRSQTEQDFTSSEIGPEFSELYLNSGPYHYLAISEQMKANRSDPCKVI